jgi:ParB-like nuclease domain
MNTVPLNIIPVQDVAVSERMRRDLGDVDALAKSISENGLISPITLTMSDDGRISLVAGERRFTALKKLGITELIENEHFKWRIDVANDEYRRTAIELEENIRRKALTWSEEVIGKQKLLEIYQKIYGPPAPGGISRQERIGLKPLGFGVRKLSELLGESATNTSEDLELAALVTKLPILAQEPSKEAARRKLDLAMKIVGGNLTPRVATPLVYKILITCDSEIHQAALLAQFRAVGLTCQAIVS